MSLFNFGAKRCIHRQDVKHHPNCFNKDGTPKSNVQMTAVKVLVLDVETLPILGYTWDVWNTNINPAGVKKDWCILSWSAKWLNDDKMMSDVLTPSEAVARDDSRLVASFWKLLDDSDIIISHNGRRFDIRKLNTRFWKNKMHPPSSYKVIDTLSAAKGVFGLTYNSQSFIAKFLGIQEKLDTDLALWISCDDGDRKSLSYMREYNENDVDMLEQIYLEIRAWIPNHPNMRVYGNLSGACPVCLSSDYREIGLYTSSTNRYKEYRCNSCGSIWHDSKKIKEK